MNYSPKIKLISDKNDLNIVSFIVLILSDIFISIILFYGLSQQIEQFTDEYKYFPYEYRNILIDKNWVENNIIEKTAEHILSRKRATYEKINIEYKLHPKCQEIEDVFKEIENDNNLVLSLEEYERLSNNYYTLNKAEKESEAGERLQEEIVTAEKRLKEEQKIDNLIETVFRLQKYDFTKDIIRFRKVFALKRTIFDFVFLLPVLVGFIYWNRRAFKTESYIQVIVSSHYIIVAFLPIFFEIIRLVIEVIPKILLKTIYDFLLKLNLITLWYYAVLLFSVFFIIFIIWFLQTKIFTKEKYSIKQYEKSKCIICNTRVDYSNNNCPACGALLKVKCKNCGKETINNLPYCINCGSKNI